MDPRNIDVSKFNYSLPDENIAYYPLAKRDESKLLLYRNAVISETEYRHIAGELPENSLLAFNNTRVLEARILFRKSTGATIEIFCLEPHESYADITTAMRAQGSVRWKCLIGGASKWKPGQLLQKNLIINDVQVVLQAEYIEKRPDCFIIALHWLPASISFAEVLHAAGAIPLPPYIKRLAEESDEERYQTIYADPKGSVAAPTAGLHFTEEIFRSFPQRKIDSVFLTLHVGAGTFKPVKAERLGNHEMHKEFIDVPATVISRIIENAYRMLIPIGTTSLRTLESLYWLGVSAILGHNRNAEMPNLGQWDAYDWEKYEIPVQDALHRILDDLKRENKSSLQAETRLLIAPGYKFKLCGGLVTNFHQPQSSLLLLVAALIGDDWKKVYQYALKHQFRFLSYGDGCLLFPNTATAL